MAYELPFLMADTSRLYRRAFEARIRSYGITGPQWRLLAVLNRHPGITQIAAAEILEVEPITLSRRVDRLAEGGFVERHPVHGDRRANALQLTAKAAPLIERMRQEAEMLANEVLGGFEAAEIAQFEDFINRFRCNISKKVADHDLASGDHDQ